MVKIVYRNRDGKKQYGIIDEKSRKMFYWTDWNWSKKEDEFDYNATLFLNDGKDIDTLNFLKGIDQSKAELPICLTKDSEIYTDRERTGYYTNDACSVPECEFNQIEFKTDDGKTGTLSFQENTEPWFQGDIYEFCGDEWVAELEFDMPKFKAEYSWMGTVEEQKSNWLKFHAYHQDEWKELSGDELKEFFDKSINVIIKQYEDEIKKEENKKKAKEEKKKSESKKIENFANRLNDKRICQEFIDYANKYKITDDFQLSSLVDMLNRSNAKD